MATNDIISTDTMATNDVVSVDTMTTGDVVSVDTMTTSGVASDIFKVTRRPGFLENAKVNIGRLYLRQIMGTNQSVMIQPNAVTGLGTTGVNNWAIYDGAGSQANLVANGQGMYTLAGNWNQWFTLVFEVERFKESTLQVMGASAHDKENEWAVVGGTGEFAMARGIINRRVYSTIGNTLTQELTIEFFCHMTVPAPIKRGPWGGNGGSLRVMEGKSQRLQSVTFYHWDVVNAMEFSYIDEDGEIRTAGIWGQVENNGQYKTDTIQFRPSEFVQQISGTVGNPVYLSQFKIVTNFQTYGPYGTRGGGPAFSYPVPDDETVVGFFANSDRYVYTIGVYTISK